MMLCRPIDTDGDMTPVGASSQMLSGAQAVAEAVKSRLHLLLGEWWEDTSLGFVVPRLVFEGCAPKKGEPCWPIISPPTLRIRKA